MTFGRSAGLLAFAFVTISGCKKSAGSDPAPAPDAATKNADEPPLALPVVGDTVIKGDLILTVNATGQVTSEAISSTRAETGGTVIAVLIKPGDKVSKGQALARLDTRTLDMDVKQAEASLATAKMTYANDQLDDSLNRIISTPARKEMLRARAGIDNQQIALDRANYNREHAVVTAPYSGVVEHVDVVEGDRISAGQEIAEIVDMMHLRLDARVMEHDIPALKTGGLAEVTIGAVAGKPVRGIIDAVLPLVDSVQKFGRASVRFAGDGIIRPGMFASVRLEANRLPGRIIVPTVAIVEREGRPLVFVVRNSIAEWVYINPGPHNDHQTSILPDSATGIIPLKPGDIVLVSGQQTLTHQAPVRLIAKPADDRR